MPDTASWELLPQSRALSIPQFPHLEDKEVDLDDSLESPQAQESTRSACLQLPHESRPSWSGSQDRDKAGEAVPAGPGAMATAKRSDGWMQSQQA